MPDPRSIIFTFSALSLLMSIVLFAMPRSIRERVDGARYWSIAMLALAFSALLYGLRDIIPHLLSVNLANLVSLLAQVLICIGASRFFGQPSRGGPLFAILVLANLLLTYFDFVAPSLAARVAVFSIVSALLLGLFGQAVLRFRPDQPGRARFPYLFTASAVLFDALVSLLRFCNALSSPELNENFFIPTPINVLYFYTHSLLVICISVGFILMLNERLHALLEYQLSHDSLTSTYSRSVVIDLATRELSAGRQPTALLLLDIDHFKEVNDSLGHLVGDRVLCHTVRTLEGALRPNEVLGRYGGEEFLILLRATTPEQAMMIAERLRRRVEETPYMHQGQPLATTISIGCASARPGEALEQLLHRSDTALYQAKRSGRNRVVQG